MKNPIKWEQRWQLTTEIKTKNYSVFLSQMQVNCLIKELHLLKDTRVNLHIKTLMFIREAGLYELVIWKDCVKGWKILKDIVPKGWGQ